MHSKSRSRGPRPIGDILAELMARKGFARARGEEAYQAAWQEAVGESAAGYTRTGKLCRGSLEIIVANSMLIQEFTFQKGALLKSLQQKLPDENIRDLRFKVGVIAAKQETNKTSGCDHGKTQNKKIRNISAE